MLLLMKIFDIIYLCNKYSVNWSGLESSSHVIPYLCALFLFKEGDFLIDYFDICMEEAKKSLEHGDVPIGAIVVLDGKVISSAHNTREKDKNIMGHAEINAILMASNALKRWNLADCDLYVTLEPCSMCKEVIKQSRIKNVYYLLTKPSTKKEFNKTNFVIYDNKVCEQMYHLLLSDFFKQKR